LNVLPVIPRSSSAPRFAERKASPATQELFFLPAMKKSSWLLVYLFIAIAFAYLLNAFLCGAISGPNGRYASRLIWMLPFVSLAAGIHLSRGKRSAMKWYNKLK
jgi:hypothetical protein